MAKLTTAVSFAIFSFCFSLYYYIYSFVFFSALSIYSPPPRGGGSRAERGAGVGL